jgi:hypothetical protein
MRGGVQGITNTLYSKYQEGIEPFTKSIICATTTTQVLASYIAFSP